MAEPARAPIDPHHMPWPLAAGLPELDPDTGMSLRFVEALPRLPSLDALRSLTDRDLPEGEDIPMPDSLIQMPVLGYTYYAFEHHLRRRTDVFLGADNMLYAEGTPNADGSVRPLALAPDVMVAFGVERRDRQSYVVWREGTPPAFVLEVASPSTWRRDRDVKPGLYASMGVAEYFLYDPLGGRLDPRLQGHVLRGGAYRALPMQRMDNGATGVWSAVMGLWAFLKGADGTLRWYDPVTGKELETPAEVHEAREAAEARAAERDAALEAAEARAAERDAALEAAEAKIAELRARLRER